MKLMLCLVPTDKAGNNVSCSAHDEEIVIEHLEFMTRQDIKIQNDKTITNSLLAH